MGMDVVPERFHKAYDHFFDGQFRKATSFTSSVFDFITYLVRKGYQILTTGSIDCLYHDETSYGEWFKLAESIDLRMKYTECPDSCPIAYEIFEIERDIKQVIEQGYDILKYCQEDYDKRQVTYVVRHMETIRAEMASTKNARASRPLPFTMLLHSPSGQGKSTLANMLIDFYAKTEGLKNESDFIYVRPPTAKFWDGFSSYMWCCKLDDVAYKNPGKASEDISCEEFLQIINTVPFCPDQAGVEQKGRVPFRCKLVLATTNTKDLNAYHYYSAPSAVQRRFPWVITPTVKPEYQTDDGMLDSFKTPKISGYPDYWVFKVEKPVVCPVDDNGRQKFNCTYKEILVNASLKDLFIWYKQAIEDHNRIQSTIDGCDSAIKQTALCGQCGLPSGICDCVKPQSYIVETVAATAVTLAVGTAIYYTAPMCQRAQKRVYNFTSSVRTAVNDFTFVVRGLDYWKKLGRKIYYNVFKTPKYIVYLVTFLVAAGSVIKARQLFTSSFTAQFGNIPQPMAKEQANVWKKDYVKCEKYSVTEATRSSNGQNCTQSMNVIEQNVIYLHMRDSLDDEHKETFCRALCLEGDVYAFANHTLPNWEIIYCDIVTTAIDKNVSGNKVLKLCQSQIVRRPNRDVALVKLSGMLPKRRIKILADPAYNAQCNAYYLSRSPNGEIVKRFSKGVQKIFKTQDFKGDGVSVALNNAPMWCGKLRENFMESGDCGSVLFLDTASGPIVAGLHNLGNVKTGEFMATALDTKIVGELLPLLNSRVFSETCPVLNESSSDKKDIMELHHKSPVYYTPHGTADVYGTFTGKPVRQRTNVCKTMISDYLVQEHGIVVKFTAPQLSGWKPKQIAFQDLVKPVNGFTDAEIVLCADAYYNDVCRYRANNPQTDTPIEVYDLYTAVNGTPRVSYVDSINRQTSVGFPYSKPKGSFLEAIELRDDGNAHPVMPVHEIEEQIARIISTYNNRDRNHTVYKACLKDEPVSFAKKKIGKTRVFAAVPFAAQLHTRMYTLSVIRFIMNNRIGCEAGPGTIAQSIEWGEIRNFLTAFGCDKIIAGDYKAFDKRMNSQIIMAAFSVIRRMCESSGNYSDEDLCQIDGISTDTAFPLLDYFGDLIQFHGSNPSGHPLTTIINSIANSIYMRLAYKALSPDGDVTRFQEHVHLFTYGDDNIMGVSDDAPWFNHTSIQEYLAQNDITYTMAEKEAESVPYIHINDATFLKRKWRYDELIEDYLCPLDVDSIERSLTVWTRSKNVAEEAQMVSILNSAMHEYFNYGRNVFEEKRRLFLQVIEEFELDMYFVDPEHPLLEWSDYVKLWESATQNYLNFKSDEDSVKLDNSDESDYVQLM